MRNQINWSAFSLWLPSPIWIYMLGIFIAYRCSRGGVHTYCTPAKIEGASYDGDAYARALHACNTSMGPNSIWCAYLTNQWLGFCWSTNVPYHWSHRASYKSNHSDTVVGLIVAQFVCSHFDFFFFNAGRPPPSCFFWQLDLISSVLLLRAVGIWAAIIF